MKKTIVIFAALALLATAGMAFAGAGDSVTTGNITDTATDSGTTVSIGGGQMGDTEAEGLNKMSGQVGSVEDTETDIGSVVIKEKNDQIKTGNITDSSKNTGTTVNVGSKVHEGSVVVE